jgi:hypothetical protein
MNFALCSVQIVFVNVIGNKYGLLIVLIILKKSSGTSVGAHYKFCPYFFTTGTDTSFSLFHGGVKGLRKDYVRSIFERQREDRN